MVIGAVVVGTTGCGDGMHPKKYRDFALEELDAVEYDESDFKKLKKNQQMEGAVVYVRNVEDALTPFAERIQNTSSQMLAMKIYMIAQADLESYELKDATYVEYRDEDGDNGMPEHALVSVMYRFEDREQALAAFEDYIDKIQEWNSMKFDDLEDWEYDLDDDAYEGHLAIVMTGDRLKEQITKNLDKKCRKVGIDIPQQNLEAISAYCEDEYRLAGFTCLQDRTITIVIAESWDGDDSLINPFCDYFYMDELFDHENSVAMYDGLVKSNFGSTIVENN